MAEAAVVKVRNPPARYVWQEEALVRAAELSTLCEAVAVDTELAPESRSRWWEAVDAHLMAVRDTIAAGDRRGPLQRLTARFRGSDVLRVAAHLDAAEAGLLRIASLSYVSAGTPALIAQIRSQLSADDPRRVQAEDVARRAAVDRLSEPGREALVVAAHAAASERRRHLTRIRSFQHVLWATALMLTIGAVVVATVGALAPDRVPLCFNSSGEIYCPSAAARAPDTDVFVDAVVREAASPWDIAIVEIIGVLAAAITAAFALRGIRGTSTPYGLAVALAGLKLPTGALAAVLGLLLLRGDFIPEIDPVTSSAEILGWAVVFGAAQELLTRLVDRQAIAVLDGAGADRVRTSAQSVALEVRSAVAESIEAALTEPPLVAYTGHVIAWIERHGEPVPFTEGRVALPAPGDYALILGLTDSPQHRGMSRRVEIPDGAPASTAEFEFSLTSNTVYVTPEALLLTVPTDGELTTLTIPISVPSAKEHRISVSVLQQSRLLQILDLRLSVGSA